MKYPDITLGRIEAVWNKLGGEKGVQHLLSGVSEIVIKKHVIDLQAVSYVSSNWTVEEHQKGTPLQWDVSKVQLYLDNDQKNGKSIEGSKLHKLLVGKPVMNANVLDYLVANPFLIPKNWRRNQEGHLRRIFFWGTIYRDSKGKLHVRYMSFNNSDWNWYSSACGLDDFFRDNDPAAYLRAS